MWLSEAYRKGLHILGGCLNIWMQGFRPFFFSCFRCVDTNCFLPSKYSSKPLSTGGDFFLPFLMIGDMY